MKLLTLNCHGWMEKEPLKKLEIIKNAIKKNDYDIISFQEVNQSKGEKFAYDNIKKDNYILVLQEMLKKDGICDYEMYWDFAHFAYDKYEEGVCILSKHKIKNKKSFFISKGEDETNYKTRKIIKIDTEVSDKEVSILACHLGWFHDEEEPFSYQVESLVNKIDNDKLTFLMGDFNNNAFARNRGYDLILSKGLKDTFNLAKKKDLGVTMRGAIDGWTNNTEDMRIDLILCNKEVEVEYSRVIFDGNNENVVSDHYGVEVKIKGI